MGKERQPGENISFKTKKNEHALIMQWLNLQTNVTDSIRYLIEKEITQFGVRDLQQHIPSVRNFNPQSNSIEIKPIQLDLSSHTIPVGFKIPEGVTILAEMEREEERKAVAKAQNEMTRKAIELDKEIVSYLEPSNSQPTENNKIGAEIDDDDIQSWR